MKFLKKRIKGIGWQGLIIELGNKDTFELTNLIQANPKNILFFWKVHQEVTIKIPIPLCFTNQILF